MLVVIGIIVLLTVFLAPAFNAIKGGNDMTGAANSITAALEHARAYAMKNNTYVFVGFAEVDATVSDSAIPQVTTGTTPYGRVAVAMVASKDGTRGYDINNPGDGTSGSWVTNYSNYNGVTTPAANLTPIGKLQRFENLHFLVDFPTWPKSSHPNSSMARQSPLGGGVYTLGNTACKSVTPFTWPLGSSLTAGQYRFDKVINFDPQGAARIQYSSSADDVVQRMEIDLQPARGSAVPPVPSNQDLGNELAIQLDAMTGETRIFRP